MWKGKPGPLLILALVVPCVWAAVLWEFTIDDSFISLRYARNMALGHGPVFNIGERVEGYSCPLWVATLTIPYLAGIDAVAFSKVVGLLSYLGLLLIVYLGIERHTGRSRLAEATTLCVSVIPSFSFYAVSGMETVPFALAVCAATILPGLCERARNRNAALFLSLLAVATLRPEGGLVAALVSLFWLVRGPVSARWSVLALGAVVIGLVLARYAYYGSFLPNTFYAKPSLVMHTVRTGDLGQTASIFVSQVLLGDRFYGGVAVTAGFLATAWVGRHSKVVVPPVLAGLTGFLFLFYAPRDWMPFERFFSPFIAPVLFVVALGLGRLPLRAEGVRRAEAVGVALVFLVWCPLNLAVSAYVSQHRAVQDPALDGRRFEEMGDWIKRRSRPDDSVLAFEIGGVGYASNLRIIDHEGLIEPVIARKIREVGGYDQIRQGGDPVAMEWVAEYSRKLDPTWFLVHAQRIPAGLRPNQPVPARLATEEIQAAMLRAFGDSMVLQKVFRIAPTGYYLVLRRVGA